MHLIASFALNASKTCAHSQTILLLHFILQTQSSMKGFYILLAVFCHLQLQACPVKAQTTFPTSELYIPLKFDLGIGNATQISTVEGNSTNLISQTLRINPSQVSPGISSLNQGFVDTQGSQFILNGNPWYCAGTNAYYAGLKYIMSDNEVSVMMKVSWGKCHLTTYCFSYNSNIFFSPASFYFFL